MSHHEAFWTVVGTAAPVIALAAVVALPDSSIAAKEASRWSGVVASIRVAADQARQALALARGTMDLSQEADSYEVERDQSLSEREARRSYRLALAVQLGSFVNVIVQAGLLALSLTALAYDRDVVPPWVAITLAVGGILLLAWALVAGANFRKEFEGFELVRKTHERPD